MTDGAQYAGLLKSRRIQDTPHRLAVLEAVAGSPRPLTAMEVLDWVRRRADVNKVTVYRILDLFVEKGLVERMSAGDRSFRYGLSPDLHDHPHAHFYCRQCGTMKCLDLDELPLNLRPIELRLGGVIEKVEVRLDGTCPDCLRDG